VLPGPFAEGDTFRLLVSAVTDYAIYMLDPSGYVVSWNAGAQRFKGYTADEIIGQHFSRFYTEEDARAGAPAAVLRTAETEGRFEAEGWRVRKDGSRFWAHVVVDPIRDDSGGLIGFAKITRDLSERKRAEQSLQEAREALLQSQKMEAIGQLTGGVAHDFNNLLTAVMGSLELVQKRVGEDPRVADLLATALQAAQRGAILTQRMLAFARRQDLKVEPTDVRELVTGMTDLFDRSLGAAVSIVTHFPLSMGKVMVDRNQLEMALLNLALNARDAMPDGGPLEISALEETIDPVNRLELGAGRYAVLSVTDHGNGMDEATLRRAAEPFYTTKGVGKGTGLGLSMVHGLAEQMGGRLDLQSKPDTGTTANLWLPIADPAADVAAPPLPPAAAAEGQQRSLAILAVDDDFLVLSNTAAMLDDLGHRTTMAHSGRDALKALRETKFDLLITDQGMPGMTGLELIAQVLREQPELPIMLATGYAELPAGTAQTIPRLAKPFLQAQLADAVRSATSAVGA
jgi:PAS domain S-box-containing protein